MALDCLGRRGPPGNQPEQMQAHPDGVTGSRRPQGSGVSHSSPHWRRAAAKCLHGICSCQQPPTVTILPAQMMRPVPPGAQRGRRAQRAVAHQVRLHPSLRAPFTHQLHCGTATAARSAAHRPYALLQRRDLVTHIQPKLHQHLLAWAPGLPRPSAWAPRGCTG